MLLEVLQNSCFGRMLFMFPHKTALNWDLSWQKFRKNFALGLALHILAVFVNHRVDCALCDPTALSGTVKAASLAIGLQLGRSFKRT
jgi:hypothetical protein